MAQDDTTTASIDNDFKPALPEASLDQLFRQARTYNRFSGEVDDATLRRLYDLLKWGPTTSNSCPARFVFVRSQEAKAKLGPALDEGNYKKTMAAPCTAIIAYDVAFFEKVPVLFPHTDARGWFDTKPEPDLRTIALRNGSLQGAYLLLAARSLGLDCGPMSGFDNAKVDAEFFPDGQWKSNFLCNLGKGDPSKLPLANPRFEFDEVCKIL